MQIGFIGQGFGIESESAGEIVNKKSNVEKPPTTIGEAIISSLTDPAFHSAQFVVAYATSSGIGYLTEALEKESGVSDAVFYVGVDGEATTKQALEELVDSDIQTSVFRANRREIEYHPKVYLFHGDEKTRAIVGSANATDPAFRSNIEAGFVYEVDTAETGGRNVIEDIERTLIAPVREGSKELEETLLDQLIEEGRIGDEAARSFEDTRDISSETDDELLNIGVDLDVRRPILPSPTVTEGRVRASEIERQDTDDLPSRDELPPIPKVDTETLTQTDRRFYERLLRGTDNQPSITRRIIYANDEITQNELKRCLIEEHGYEDSGSIIASLRVHFETTGEVRKEGEGPHARLIWVGDRVESESK
ncbi:phospholipase D family protein [Natrialbaceae archaeon A-CW1-1]